MKESVYIQGLNRQAKYFGLPLPLAGAAFMPPFFAFIVLDSLWYLLGIVVLWLVFWIAFLTNPHFPRFIAVVLAHTPERVLRPNSGSKYD